MVKLTFLNGNVFANERNNKNFLTFLTDCKWVNAFFDPLDFLRKVIHVHNYFWTKNYHDICLELQDGLRVGKKCNLQKTCHDFYLDLQGRLK